MSPWARGAQWHTSRTPCNRTVVNHETRRRDTPRAGAAPYRALGPLSALVNPFELVKLFSDDQAEIDSAALGILERRNAHLTSRDVLARGGRAHGR